VAPTQARGTGAYTSPALPNDPLLLPTVPTPELSDRKLWARAHLDPQHLTPPGGSDSAKAIVAEYADPHSAGAPDELTAVAPIDASYPIDRDVSQVMEVSPGHVDNSVEALEGTPGPDVLVGNNRGNALIGKGGNDVLRARGGNGNRLVGGGGKDRLVGRHKRNTLRQ
jgi:hypothetical protein